MKRSKQVFGIPFDLREQGKSRREILEEMHMVYMGMSALQVHSMQIDRMIRGGLGYL